MGYVSTQVVRSGAPMSRPCGVFELPREGEFLRPFNSRMSRPVWNLGDGLEQLSYAATSFSGQ